MHSVWGDKQKNKFIYFRFITNSRCIDITSDVYFMCFPQLIKIRVNFPVWLHAQKDDKLLMKAVVDLQCC
jgi:hypothetical protein